jgi:hypothetical protein
MVFDELIENIQKVSDEKFVQDIVHYLSNWKNDDRNVDRLDYDFEKYMGNTWIENKNDFKKIYEMWMEFKNESIKNIKGMTMNERLYIFGLMGKFDSCKNEDEKNNITKKLNIRLDKYIIEQIKGMLQALITISEDTKRNNLYKTFFSKLILAQDNEQKNLLNSIYNNFSGLMAHAELENNEYIILKSLLNKTERYL